MKSQIKHKQFDFILLILIIMLLGTGILMLGSSSFVRGSYLSDDSMHFMRNQAIYALGGVAVMIALSFVDYKIYKRFAGYILIVALGLNYATALIGQVRNDAQRWLKIGGFSFQPSEALKIALIIYLASVLSDTKWGEKSEKWFGLVSLVLPIGASLLAVVLQKHMSATIIIGLICVAVMLFGGVRWYVFGTIIGSGAAGVLLISKIKPDLFEHVGNRFEVYAATVFGNTTTIPEGMTEEALSQIHNSILAIGSGGLWGLGFGKSIQKYSYLPEAYNDFIFAITAEELGFAGVAAILLIFGLFFARGFKAALHCEEKFGTLIAAGIMTMMALQTVLNIAVVSALIPVTGVSMPFFSYGGSSVVIILACMGILLNIAKQSNYSKF
ncbi:MAG: putative lipid II flippase FtsW [Clostridia bacterium]|nr:putative lipid II flippase FtsW [Clostridia bacterium]